MEIKRASVWRVSIVAEVEALKEPEQLWGRTTDPATQELPSISWKNEGSIPYSQEPSTGPYPEKYESNPHHPILSLSDPF
jgi:hypothetical protein